MPVADKNGTAMIIKIKDIRPSRFGVAHASATVRSRPGLLHSSTENGFECCPLSTGLKQLASRRKRAPTEADAKNDPTEVVLAALASHPPQCFQIAFHKLHDELIVAG